MDIHCAVLDKDEPLVDGFQVNKYFSFGYSLRKLGLRETRGGSVNESNGEKVAQINRAEGEAQALLLVAKATAESIALIAGAVRQPGGMEAVNLKIAEQYVEQFGKLAKESNTLIMPANVADIGSLVSAGMHIVQGNKANQSVLNP